MIVLFATLANADDWVEIALFAEDYQDYLRKYIELKMGLRLMTQSVGVWG
ncbi:MAG: transposase family protein [Coprococcus phoceensis]